MITFKAKPVKNGGSWCIIIPAYHKKQGTFDPNKEYQCNLEEAI